jgi:metal-responsive CopG/Arc/MetJ family transcriptional regulator
MKKHTGPGRPPVSDAMRQETVSIRLPRYVIDGMDKMIRQFDGAMTRSSLIRDALISELKLKKPKQ